MKNAKLTIILPVYNEEKNISHIIQEIFTNIQSPYFHLIVCENGSTDKTLTLLRRLRKQHRFTLITSPARLGYAKTILQGFSQASSPHILCLDSDGQCDPKEFNKLWRAKDHFDIVVGIRINRKDPLQRRVFSFVFGRLFAFLFSSRFHDPSSPFILMKKSVARMLSPHLGSMNEGFWWEFSALSAIYGYSRKEVAITHRSRLFGQTNVYAPDKIIPIGIKNTIALFHAWRKKKTFTKQY